MKGERGARWKDKGDTLGERVKEGAIGGRSKVKER